MKDIENTAKEDGSTFNFGLYDFHNKTFIDANYDEKSNPGRMRVDVRSRREFTNLRFKRKVYFWRITWEPPMKEPDY